MQVYIVSGFLLRVGVRKPQKQNYQGVWGCILLAQKLGLFVMYMLFLYTVGHIPNVTCYFFNFHNNGECMASRFNGFSLH